MVIYEHLLENFFTLSLDLMCIVDRDGYFRKLSDSWSLLGYPIPTLIGKHCLDYVHPDDILATQTAINRLRHNEAIDGFRNRYRCKDGSYRMLAWRCRKYDDFIFAIARDVTDMNQTQQALIESESRYRSVIASMSEGVVIHAQDGTIQTCNPAAERILGLTQDQMKGLTSIDPRWRAIHEDGSPFPGETHPAMITLKTGQRVSNVVMGVHKPDGELTWILVNSEPVLHDSVPTSSAVVATFTDITELKRISEALKQSESRFRTISELISDFAYGFSVSPDGELHYEWTIGAIKPITGYTAEMIAERKEWESLFYPEDMPLIEERFADIMRGKERIDEFRIINALGEIRWIRDYSKPIWDAEKQCVTFLYGAAQDITAQKQAEQQKQEIRAERDRINILTDFITATSHELRTPLSVINTSLYLLMRLDDTDKRKEKAQQITEQVIYLNRVITQLHEVVRLDRITELELEPIALVSFVTSFINEYQYRHQQVILNSQATEDLLMIQGSRIHLQNLLTQLVDNAMCYSPPASAIQIMMSKKEEFITLAVQDEGTGIEPEDLQKIFNPLYKVNTARTRNENGVGVGLTIAKRIMQLHHGHITVDSKVGKGTTFTLYFPIPPMT